MNKEHRTPIFFFAVYFFIFLFLYTAADKVMNHETFENVLSRSVLIGPTSAYIAWLVPASEILIGITLLVPKTQKTGLLLSLLLMSIFTIYLIFMVSSGSTLPCHCGGIISRMTWTQHIWFNIACIVLAALALLKPNPNPPEPISVNS